MDDAAVMMTMMFVVVEAVAGMVSTVVTVRKAAGAAVSVRGIESKYERGSEVGGVCGSHQGQASPPCPVPLAPGVPQPSPRRLRPQQQHALMSVSHRCLSHLLKRIMTKPTPRTRSPSSILSRQKVRQRRWQR